MVRSKGGRVPDHESAKHHAAAAEEYGTVEASPADLKSLISDVAKASKEKADANKKLSKKQLKQQKEKLKAEAKEAKRKEVLLDAEAAVDAEILDEEKKRNDKLEKKVKDKKAKQPKVKKDVDRLAAFEEAFDRLHHATNKFVLASATVSGTDVARLKSQFEACYKMWQNLDGQGKEKAGQNVEDLLRELQKQIKTLGTIAVRNDKQKEDQKQRTREVTERQQQATSFDKAYQSKLSKFLDLGRDGDGRTSLSRSFSTAARIAGRNLMDGAKQRLSPNIGEKYDAAVQWMMRRAGDNVKVVAAIQRVDNGLRMIGTEVKSLGVESFKMLTDRMSAMFGFLRRKWSDVRGGSSGFGTLGKLLGFGALVSSVIAPLLAGINEELENRYGKHYLQGFIDDAWTKAKSWMLDGFKNFFKIPEAPPPPANPLLKPAIDAVKNSAPVQAVVKEDAKYGQEAHDSPFKYWANKTAGFFTGKTTDNSHLEELLAKYKAAKTPMEKAQTGAAIRAFIAQHQGATIKADVYTGLQGAKFDVSGLTAEQPRQYGVFMGSSGASAGGGRGKINPAIASGAPMDGASAKATPVTAAPMSSSRQESTGTTGPTSSPKGIALGAAQIPNNVHSDGLHYVNVN